jgi:hypothetical protein
MELFINSISSIDSTKIVKRTEFGLLSDYSLFLFNYLAGL